MLALRAHTVRPFTSPRQVSGRAVYCQATHSHQHGAGQPSAPASSWGRRFVLGAGLTTGLIAVPLSQANAENIVDIVNRQGEVRHTEEEWKELLSSGQYSILRREGTERPWSSPLNNEKRKGTFVCAGCGAPLFDANTKYNSGTGWPSFYEARAGAVTEVPDYSIPFLPRTEVRCKRCQGHLGHVFDDGPAPTGLRYCMNGLALGFESAEEEAAKTA